MKKLDCLQSAEKDIFGTDVNDGLTNETAEEISSEL